MDAMLLCCGENGYQRVAVEHVYRRYGGYRSHFYKHFENKADCFVSAYETESERICQSLLALAAGDRDGGDGLRRVLESLAAFVSAEPVRARALFIEVHVAGDAALRKRWEVIERLSHALDSACRETKSRHSPPPSTAAFMISAIDQAVSSALLNDNAEGFAEAVPDLTALVRRAYRPR
jgi:AcrR family transcriptional regulator